jgi:broad specificity phosphatase PhoE
VAETRIYLLRHAEIAENRDEAVYGAFPNARVTEVGRRQAQAAGTYLADVPFAAAYSSSFRRARETAQLVLGERDAHLRIDDRWRERDFGEIDGLTVAQIAARFPPGRPVLFGSEDATPGGAESLQSVRDRAVAALHDLLAAHAGEPVLVVSHKTTIRVLLCHLLGAPLTDYPKIGQANGALNVLVDDPGEAQVRLEVVNETGYLP